MTVGLLTAGAMALGVAAILLIRWAVGGPLSGATASLILIAGWCVGLAAFTVRRTDLSRSAPPSHHPATAALATFAAAGTVMLAGWALSTLDLGGPGFFEWSLIGVAGAAMIGAIAVWFTARRGYLDPQVASVGDLIRPEPIGGPMTMPPRGSVFRPLRAEVLWGIAIGLTVFVAYALLISSGPLGPDEAVYAVKARSWLDGSPSTGFEVYRPIGMPVIAWPILQLTEASSALRGVGVASAFVALGTLWAVGRNLFSPAAALLAVGMVAGAPSWLRRVPEFLNDILSTGLLLAVMLLIWLHFERRGTPRWAIVLSAPLGALAFYLRYGVVSALVVIAVVAAVVWRRSLLASWRPLVLTALLFGMLVLPHAVYAVATTGSVTGILTRATDAAGREFVGEGLITYLQWFPGRLAGPLLALVMAVAIVGTFVVLLRAVIERGASRSGRAVLYLGISAIAMAVLSGLFVHAEQRYVFTSIVLLALIGAHVIVATYRWTALRIRTPLLAAGALVIAGLFAVNVSTAIDKFDELSRQRSVLEAAGGTLEGIAGGDCVAISSYIPEITWYSGCETVGFRADVVAELPADASPYVVVFEHGKRQPIGGQLDRYTGPQAPVVARIGDPEDAIGAAVIYQRPPGVP